MKPFIKLAPLQGYTDYRFRNAFVKHFGGIDLFYTPYMRKQKGEIKKSMLREVDPDNNKNIPLVPQIMTNNADEFIELSKIHYNLGYDLINWNLGCPYPMVTNRKLGSGLLPFPNEIVEILENALPKIKCKVSIKMRLGLENKTEAEKILPHLNQFPLECIILHPRIGKQLYKENADVSTFKTAKSLTQHNLVYNGDINTLEEFQKISKLTEGTSQFMIGRGMLSNLFLAEEVKGINCFEDKTTRFLNFHETLFNLYDQTLSGDHQILSKLKPYWEYFSEMFENPRKTFKTIKKCKQLNDYRQYISSLKILATSKTS